MARTPSDATRFTATGPYASSSPGFTSNSPNASATASASSGSGSQISFGAPAPAGETAQQKIARLRAAAAAAKRGQESRFDVLVRVGRVWADRAHRVTAVGLIGGTVIAAMMAGAGITDMLLHNRRRKNEWLAQKRAEEAKEVHDARMALEEGRVTEDQLLLINRERAKFEAAEAKQNRPGVFRRTTNWLFSGLSSEERKGGKLGGGVAAASGVPQSSSEEILGEREDKGVLRAVEERVEANRRSGERVEDVLRPLGGPLDREAQRTANAVADTGKSWMSRITGK